jgi:cell cycle sensor histidine kinase DivJ
MLATIAATGFAGVRAMRREARCALAQGRDDMAETMGCLVIGCDQSGLVSSASANCEVMLGMPPSELMGRGFFERVHVADRPAFLKAISDASAGPAVVITVLRWRGSRRVERSGYAEPVFLCLEMRVRREATYFPAGGDFEESAVAAVLRDITEDKVSTPANLSTGNFFAHAGHELRAPLAAITGFSELLAGPQLAPQDPEKQREYASIIHQSARHLLEVIDAFLELSTVQSGSMEVAPERFAVAPLVDLCCDMVKLQAMSSGISLARAYHANLDKVVTDRRLFTQILVNLLSNAIKFTPPNGSVTVSARQETDDFLTIEVNDTGIGIAAHDLDHLGAPFFQAKGLAGREHKGTGLGLAIVRNFIGLLGGTISVASEPGKGTCVRVLLPVVCNSPAAQPRGGAKIETLTRLPAPGQNGAHKPIMVNKIA